MLSATAVWLIRGEASVFQSKSFSPKSFSPKSWWQGLAVAPKDDPRTLFPGACFPFGSAGLIRPHRQRKRRESEMLVMFR